MTDGQILVHVEPGAVSEQRLRYALSLAQRRSAKLVGITVRLSPAAATSAMIGDVQALAAYCDASAESCVAARNLFERVTSDAGIITEWREGCGIPIEVIVAEAAVADFVVLGRGDQSNIDGGMYVINPADVVMACGGPVIVVPGQAPAEFRADRILIGWKSTPQASRAVRDAMPLLIRAQSVLLTEIMPSAEPDRYKISAQAMAGFLEHHGVHVILHQIPEAEEPGEQLIRTARENACDLIVAGAYGHSRFREWALGGVTKSLLAMSPLPCLLSH